MTPKMPSVNLGASDEHRMPVAAETGTASGDASDGGVDEVKAPGESYEDSLEAILLQASVVPPTSNLAGSKLLGSKTLMGIGIDGLDLSAIRAAYAKAKGEGERKDEIDGKTPITDVHATERDQAYAGGTGGGGKRPDMVAQVDPDAAVRNGAISRTSLGTGAGLSQAEQHKGQSEAPRGTTLIDDVAQALNLQASEYRDRARGRLPGMPSQNALPVEPAGLSTAASERREAEFEDPDDGPTALTPGVAPVVDERDEGVRAAELSARQGGESRAFDEATIVTSAWQAGARPDTRRSGLPRISGAPVGPVPAAAGFSAGGAARTATPPAGLSPPASGSVRLPTPTPGHPLPTLPAPTIGRSSLQSGMPTSIAMTRSDSELTATAPSTPISLEASRRVMANIAAPRGSGRVSSRAAGSVTEPVIRSFSTMPFLLKAHIKIATVSLAGLIAVTFAGGLLVGMLVWKGQGRVESAVTPRAVTPVQVTGAVAQPPVPSVERPGQAVVAGSSATAPRPDEAASVAAAAGPTVPSAAAEVKKEGRVQGANTPLAPDTESEQSTGAAGSNRRTVAVSRGVGTRGSAPIPPANDTASSSKPLVAKPVTRPAPSPGSKPIANNAAGKTAAKSKAKPAWHDPFAD
jgi:hypothetical protein